LKNHSDSRFAANVVENKSVFHCGYRFFFATASRNATKLKQFATDER